MKRLASVLILALAAPAAAQQPQQGALPPGHPPLGPRDVMTQAREQRERQEQEAREPRTPTPPDPIHRILSGDQPELVVARESDDLPAGTIRVTVVNPQGRPIADQPVDVGILESGARERLNGRTGPGGVVTWTDQETGGNRAYRVNVPYRGATTQSAPFRLPPDRGYDVRVTLLPTTRNDQRVFATLTRNDLSLRDERIHVVQQVQLVNVGDHTYVFPEEGKLVELPEGFTAWQWQQVMTDQRLGQTEEGFRIRGSLPPGRVDLVWAYDIPIEGTDMEIALPLPFPTFAAQVAADAPEGMAIDVQDMPSGEFLGQGEQRIWVTQKRYQNGPSPSRVTVQLSGIPGPGPLRWVALGAALLLLIGAGLFVFVPGRRPAATAEALARRRAELLDEAAEVERMFRAEEIGPRYRRRRMDAIVAELASVLRREGAARTTSERGRAGKRRAGV